MSGAPSARIGGQHLLAAAGLVAALTLLSRVVGVARWFAFSSSVGTTCVGQVYATVNQIPNVLFEIAAGGALAAVAVPLVARHLHRGEEELADRTASALLGWTLVVLLPLTLVVALAAGPLAGALLAAQTEGPVCSAEDLRAAGRLMLLLFAPQVLLYGLGIVLTGVLQAHRRFLAAALAPLLSSVVVIATYLLFGLAYDPAVPVADLPRSGLVLLALGTTLGVAALSLPLLLPVSRLGVRWRPTLRFPEGSGRVAGALAVAGLVTVGAQQVFTVVVLVVGNSVGVGAVPVWTYAQTVYLLPYAVLVVPLATAAFPRLTADRSEATVTLRRTTRAVVVGALAGAAALVAARREVGQVFLSHDRGAEGAGRATLEALPTTLAALAPGLLGFGLVALLTRALYAVGRPGWAAAGAGGGWVLAAVVGLAVSGPAAEAGVGGVLLLLALASSAGMLVSGGVLLTLTARAWGGAVLAGLARTAVVALAGTGLGVGVAQILPVDAQTLPAALAWGTVRGLLAMACVAVAVALLDRETWSLVRERVLRRAGRGEGG
ncbi:putative peptidoglycan lipid II flippase MurJ [Serinicoccus hydrothermalis]|uniref:Putative peptidoglycan lipid II flippase MurJ n=1 Tax=Serinicoccus hydrothermalis TaxID=1758689 RepID=A0A1B1N852_9MICO|nr:lipid II flippase MurJ [Serinicoccus hydrothermalis]ANS77565.1 putative peptidoglycan lipid II flippase MurJ [Serinicoccus hydrothermalis]